ncbi:MAG: response regulator [Oscillospiraceae bacterium]|nr:response regulator [Oscillospiraceae bacterium]
MTRTRHKIILVDDDLTNLSIGRNALSDRYTVITVPSAEKLFLILEQVMPDLILLDIEMPGMNGYETIRKLKSDARLSAVPVVFLTVRRDAGSELEGLSMGAVDYIAKPFSPPLLQKRVETHLLLREQHRQLQRYNDNLLDLVREKTERIYALQNAVLNTVAELVEFRDDITGGHVVRTQGYIKLLISELTRRGLYPELITDWDVDMLIPSSQLHDVGKIAVSDILLKKPGRYDPEEFDEMKKHTVYGLELIDRIERTAEDPEFFRHAKVFVSSHHEKWDGSGYPNGLRGRDIPLPGRLMAIADVYDALISVRPYKPAFSHEDSVRIIIDGRGTHFDPALVDVFADVSDQFREIAQRAV